MKLLILSKKYRIFTHNKLFEMKMDNKKQEQEFRQESPITQQSKDIDSGKEQNVTDQRQSVVAQQQQRNRRPRQHHPPRRSEGHQVREGGMEISIVVPLFNEEQSLRELYDKIRTTLGKMGRYEIIFIDDGSTDNSMRVLHELRNRDRRLKIIRFRRNYGKSAALSVGFQYAKGEIVVTMDADLQDDPEEIPGLIKEIKKGFDLVSGWKKKRHDPLSKTIPSRFFNFIVSLLTRIKIHDFNCGLKAYKREVVREIKVYGELHRYIPVLAHWQGYKVGEIPVQHHARKYGKTKFGIGRFWKGFLDLLTVLFTTRYFRRPLHLFGMWGFGFFSIGFLVNLYLVILKFSEGMSLSNRPLFIVGVLFIIVGVQIVSIGLLGEMISKTRQNAEEEYSIKEIWK
jgi:glycosyltransferase involved in cell wall biosynthesis